MIYYAGDKIEIKAQVNYLGGDNLSERLGSAVAGDVLIADINAPQSERALKTGRQKNMITVIAAHGEITCSGSLLPHGEIIIADKSATLRLTGITPDCEVNVALAAKKLRNMGATNIVIIIDGIGAAVIAGQEITLVRSNATFCDYLTAVAVGSQEGKTLADSVAACGLEFATRCP